MKKVNKIVILILINIVISMSMNINVYGAININNIKSNKIIGGETEIRTMSSIIYTTITNIGIVLSVVILAILGVKYMLGSVEERAEYKKSMLPYLIGTVLVFSASTIANIIYELAK